MTLRSNLTWPKPKGLALNLKLLRKSRVSDRLASLLAQCAAQGVTQAKIAREIGVAPQFFCDLLRHRRPLTELIARRLGDYFKVDYRSLLTPQGSAPQAALASDTFVGSGTCLPILPHPVEGDPKLHRRWNGNYVQVPSVAMQKLVAATDPYVLRYGNPDTEDRLHAGDLVLISQSLNDTAQISVVKTGRKCSLCRRKNRRWVRLATGEALSSDAVVVGHCLGILWSTLL